MRNIIKMSFVLNLFYVFMLDSHALAFRCIRIRVRISAIDLRLWLHLTNSSTIDINRACHPKHVVELS